MKNKILRKNKERKVENFKRIIQLVKDYKYLIILENTDIPSNLIRSIRTDMSDCTVIFAKKSYVLNKFNIKEIEDKNVFFLFSNSKDTDVFSKYKYPTFLEEGDVVEKDIIIKGGMVKNKELVDYIPTIYNDNIHVLEEDYTVCKKNTQLTEKQAKILELLKYKLKEAPVRIIKVVETEEIQ